MNNPILLKMLSVFTLDVRALSLMRIGIAGILMADVIIRMQDVTAFYSNAGAMPMHILTDHCTNNNLFSLHILNHSSFYQTILFLIQFIVSFLLLLGYKTRIVTILSWLLLISVQNYNTVILQSGDDWLRLTIFWGIFLPWGNFYSLDQLNNRSHETKILSVASSAYVLQIIFVYVFSALLKNSAEWQTDGTAIYYALSLDQMVLPLGKMIYPYYAFLKYLTFIVYYIELIVPLLLFIPFKNSFFRILVFIILLFLQIGIASTLYVGLFFAISIVSTIGILPSGVCDKVDYFLMKKLHSPIWSFIIFIKKAYHKILSFLSVKDLLKASANGLIIFFILYTLVWNLQTLPNSGFSISETYKQMGYSLRLDQKWGMFAPSVFKDDGWYIMKGMNKNGDSINILKKGIAINYEKEANLVSTFKNDRWRKYSENLLLNSDYPPFYCRYLLNKWNHENPEKKIIKLELIYVKETSLLPPYYTKLNKEVLCECKK